MGELYTPLESLRKALENAVSSALYGDGWTIKTTESGNAIFETTAEPVEESEQEQERKTSEWLHINDDIYECKNFGISTQVDENFGSPAYKFCPYCGAEMIIYNL